MREMRITLPIDDKTHNYLKITKTTPARITRGEKH